MANAAGARTAYAAWPIMTSTNYEKAGWLEDFGWQQAPARTGERPWRRLAVKPGSPVSRLWYLYTRIEGMLEGANYVHFLPPANNT